MSVNIILIKPGAPRISMYCPRKKLYMSSSQSPGNKRGSEPKSIVQEKCNTVEIKQLTELNEGMRPQLHSIYE